MRAGLRDVAVPDVFEASFAVLGLPGGHPPVSSLRASGQLGKVALRVLTGVDEAVDDLKDAGHSWRRACNRRGVFRVGVPRAHSLGVASEPRGNLEKLGGGSWC